MVGASGAVIGLVGMFCADIAINWETLLLPWLRLAVLVVGIVLMVVLQVSVAWVVEVLKVIGVGSGWVVLQVSVGWGGWTAGSVGWNRWVVLQVSVGWDGCAVEVVGQTSLQNLTTS